MLFFHSSGVFAAVLVEGALGKLQSVEYASLVLYVSCHSCREFASL